MKQHLDQASQLQSDNLPFYANFLADVAGNFLTNILTGKSKAQVLKEGGIGALNGALIGVSQAVQGNQIPSGGANNGGGTGTGVTDALLQAYITPKGAASPQNPTLEVGKEYDLNIIVDVEGLRQKFEFLPEKIRIKYGANDSSPEEILINASDSPKKTVVVPLARIENGQIGDTLTVEVTRRITGADTMLRNVIINYKVQQADGSVKGAFTGKPSGSSIIMPRGPQISFR